MVYDTGITLSQLLTHVHSATVGHMPRLTRLRDLRIRAALTQIELADLAGLSRGTIIRLEQGDEKAVPTTLRKLTRALRLKQPSELWED